MLNIWYFKGGHFFGVELYSGHLYLHLNLGTGHIKIRVSHRFGVHDDSDDIGGGLVVVVVVVMMMMVVVVVMLVVMMLVVIMMIRVSQKIQKSEFWNATYPSGFHRLDEPPEKISAL